LEEKCEISKGMIQLQDHPKEFEDFCATRDVWGFDFESKSDLLKKSKKGKLIWRVIVKAL